jgi:hypothetical protein
MDGECIEPNKRVIFLFFFLKWPIAFIPRKRRGLSFF